MQPFHFSNFNSISQAMVGFTSYCRESELPIGLSHTQEALTVSKLGFTSDQDTLKHSLRSLFCTCEEDFDTFNKCFNTFWKKRKHEYAPKTTRENQANVTKKHNASLVMAGFNPNKAEDQKEEDAKSITGESRIESLRKTDFSKLVAGDSDILDQIAERLLIQLNHRLKRKLTSVKKGRIDLRKTIRNNLSNGDLLIDLAHKNRKQEKYRLILLLDVSGSMDKYSFFLLKFIMLLKGNLKNIEAFVFSTKLVRITDFVRHSQISVALMQMGEYADNWSGGTRIGECLKSFNDGFSKRILNGKSVTIVLSDGLDTGESELLSEELQKIKMRTSKLIWMNPLKGMDGYEPIAKGMSAALPQIDRFESAHNLNSLLELENILANA